MNKLGSEIIKTRPCGCFCNSHAFMVQIVFRSCLRKIKIKISYCYKYCYLGFFYINRYIFLKCREFKHSILRSNNFAKKREAMSDTKENFNLILGIIGLPANIITLYQVFATKGNSSIGIDLPEIDLNNLLIIDNLIFRIILLVIFQAAFIKLGQFLLCFIVGIPGFIGIVLSIIFSLTLASGIIYNIDWIFWSYIDLRFDMYSGFGQVLSWIFYSSFIISSLIMTFPQSNTLDEKQNSTSIWIICTTIFVLFTTYFLD